MSRPTLYTIGHSTHLISKFLQLLEPYHINCIIDVRSVAASRFNPQYNKKALAIALGDSGITYLHFESEFGARQTNPALLDNDGKVDFKKVRDAEPFKRGIERLREGVGRGYVPALMCSEADPLRCHRFAMISPALLEFEVKHILKDASVISQQLLEQQLLKTYERRLAQLDIFQGSVSEAERLSLAFELLNKEVAYTPAEAKRFKS